MMLSPRAREILASLPIATQKAIYANPKIIQTELANREKFFPSKNLVPNIAQERALECCRQRHPKTGDFCKENHFIAGNGVGKTCAGFGILLAGVTLGPEFLHPTYFANHEFFKWCKEIRSKRMLNVRIVCDSADVEENGSVTQNVKKWLPVAKLAGKVGGGKSYYTGVEIPSPMAGYEPTKADVKTFGQATTAHAGSEIDVLIFNEPPPQNVYEEEMSRIRRGGYAFGFLTPLNAAPYLIKVIDSPGGDGKISVTNGSIWDNCRDVPGTRGILTRGDVEDQIRRWMAIDPLVADARIWGRFMQLSGAVFKIFNRQTHVIPPRAIPSNWNVFHCVDPHPHKPAFATWMALSPAGDWYVIAEYPVEPWDQVHNTHLTIKNFCNDFQRISDGSHWKFMYMQGAAVQDRHLGDPNAFRCEQPHNRRTFKEEYEWESGWDFDIDIPDGVELRFNRIKELLQYDPQRAIDSMNRPHLYVFDTCENTARAFQNFIYKQKQGEGHGLSDKVDDTWECPIACVGYTVLAVDSWSPTKRATWEKSREYEEIMASRDPDRFDPNVVSFDGSTYSGERWI